MVIARASRACAKHCLRFSNIPKRSYSAPADNSIPANKQKYVPTSGTYPKGFIVGSAHAGVKASNTKYDDLALIASQELCSAAVVTTINTFKAAPVQVTQAIMDSSKGRHIRGVIINSGCANAVTGTGGLEDATIMAKMADDCFKSTPEAVEADEGGQTKSSTTSTLVMSTGVIGQRLPIDRITSKISTLYDNLGETHDHWLRTARAICTTDTFPKLISRQFSLPSSPGVTYSIAGMTKGAGMIHPNMATLLSVICTDAKIDPDALRSLLKSATDRSFNSISIDGDTSTNDTVAIFANGAAAKEGTPCIKKVETLRPKDQSDDYRAMHSVLRAFMMDLAQLVVRDGEGATKFVTVRVKGAVDRWSAKAVANTIANSSLVKTALYGKDANWGRILCAIGYSPARRSVVPAWTSVSFIPSDGSEELRLLVRGEPETVDEERAKKILEMEDLEILVRLNDGATDDDMIEHQRHLEEDKRQWYGHRNKVIVLKDALTGPHTAEAVVWTCDFSHEYVTINGDYRT